MNVVSFLRGKLKNDLHFFQLDLQNPAFFDKKWIKV